MVASVKFVIDLKDNEIEETHVYNTSGNNLKIFMRKKANPTQNNQNLQRLPMAEVFDKEHKVRGVIFGEIECRRCNRG